MKLNREHRTKKDNCFVMLPFNAKVESEGKPVDWVFIYEDVIGRAVKDLNMKPIKADGIYSSESILERTWKGIQEAEIIIADLTGRDPNVLYALGLAHIIRKTVIIIAMSKSDIPSDFMHFINITYSAGQGLVILGSEIKKALQSAKEEPKEEMTLHPMDNTIAIEKKRGKVLSVTPEVAVVQTEDGRKGMLSPEDVIWNKLSVKLEKRFKVGDAVDGAFVRGVKGEIKYSLIADTPNPWLALEKECPINEEREGDVAEYIPKTGVFVRMSPNYEIDGLIPSSKVPRDERFTGGDKIKFRTVQINPVTREAEVSYIRHIHRNDDGIAPGKQFDGTVVHVNNEKGFVLIKIKEDLFAGILNIHNMSESFKSRFKNEQVEVSTNVRVEILNINRFKRKMSFKDIP